MVEQEQYKKQVVYGGFNARIFAALIDLTLSSLLMLPVIKIFSLVIYGQGNAPAKALQPALERAAKNNEGVGDILKQAFTSPEAHHYFFEQGGLFRMVLDQLFQLGFMGALFVAFWVYFSATPGKMMVSLKIADAKTLQPPTKKQYIIRFIGSIISVLPLFLGIFAMLFNKKRQTWHDRMAGTVVIKR